MDVIHFDWLDDFFLLSLTVNMPLYCLLLIIRLFFILVFVAKFAIQC